MQWAYDPSPPHGIPARAGITVNAIFTDPGGREYAQPAFYSEDFLDEVRDGRDWHLPMGHFRWRVRFSPNRIGTWNYRIVATDTSGTAESPRYTFSVSPSTERGFIRVSKADSRYFEFDNGSTFVGMGMAVPTYLANPTSVGRVEYAKLGGYGISLVRLWISSIFGSAWSSWIGGRNQYRGYLPVAGLVPFHDNKSGRTTLNMLLDYEPGGDTGWFDACRMQLWDLNNQYEAVEPYKTYRIRVHFHGVGIQGPRNSNFLHYGLVAKIGDGKWHPDCYEPGSATPVTGYGLDTDGFGYIEGKWFSGERNFQPGLFLALENVTQGAAFVQSVSLREDLGNGEFGPELMREPSMEHESYVPEEEAYSFDKIVENAERNGVYLKVVLSDLNDEIWFKLSDNGDWITKGSDNEDGFYGLGRSVNKTRWLQQMWWRYVQARWGYSTAVHSWELTNEGDPSLQTHYEMADEFGKFMHCRVFGIEPGMGGGRACHLEHPNDHFVTTSFWQSFPAKEFWSNPRYPNLDYADVHAYVSTSSAPLDDRRLMQWDAAYYHTWHSQHLPRVGKPIVRGEGGLDAPDQPQSETVLGIRRDTAGVWLHNFLWSALDSGALYEIYWYGHGWSGGVDLRGAYRAVRAFLDDIPLSSGGYVDWGGSVSSPALRVVGQKNTKAGLLHMWIQNRAHTWKDVVDGTVVSPTTADVVVSGFRPGTAYGVERWDTWVPGGCVASVDTLQTDGAGRLRIVVRSLTTDLAIKVKPKVEDTPSFQGSSEDHALYDRLCPGVSRPGRGSLWRPQ